MPVGRGDGQSGDGQAGAGGRDEQPLGRWPGPAATLGVDGNRDALRVVVDHWRRSRGRDVAEKQHGALDDTLVLQSKLGIELMAAGSHQRPLGGRAIAAFAEHLRKVRQQFSDWNAGRQGGVDPPPGTDDGHTARRVDVVLLCDLSGRFLD